MKDDGYRKALDEALAEYARLVKERDATEERLGQLAQTIGALSKLCGLKASLPLGLTDACRLALRNAQRPLSPTELRDALTGMGFDLKRYASELAPIHTVLKRLHGSGEAEVVRGAEAKPSYAWKGPFHVPFEIAGLFGLPTPSPKKAAAGAKKKTGDDDDER